jgi:hypothetical protein
MTKERLNATGWEIKKLNMKYETLFKKWEKRIGKGWYGFDSIPDSWAEQIDELLNEIKLICPNFEIHQIKLKFGGIRIYLELNSEDKKIVNYVNEKIDNLENILFDEKLIY